LIRNVFDFLSHLGDRYRTGDEAFYLLRNIANGLFNQIDLALQVN